LKDAVESRSRSTANLFRRCVLAATAALIALVFWWFARAGLSVSRMMWAAAVTSPLWLSAPKLWTGHRRSYAWMSLIVIPYFVLAITEAVANPHHRGWAAMCLFVAFTLFVLLIAYLRMTRQQEQNVPHTRVD
jgi:uncharacterized membrane protein